MTGAPTPTPHPASADSATSAASPWWRHAAVYQVYLQSFADSDGDGVGDLAGLLERLDYIRDLGVDAIWITPWYPSPFNDGGYDIADYLDIDPHYGTLADARRLIEAAHDAEIKVIIDLVPNHTSTEHHWFVEALADGPGSAARDRYLFRPGRGPDGSLPPSDWQSIFGGSAWTQVADGEWYLHLFHNSQADINWENDAVREAFDGVLRYWLDLGVDGFRVDVAHGMIKGEPATDLGSVPELHTPIHRLPDHLDHPAWDRDGVHDLARRWRSVLDEYGDRLMVAEAVVHPTRLARYLRSDEYHQSFNFDLLEADWDAETFRSIIESSLQTLEEVDALPTWVVSNHDVVRPATRYGLPLGTDWYRWSIQGPREALDENLGARRARAIALITLGLPGAVYIYQGEELGLPEAWDLPPEVLRDPTWEQSGHTLKGRDGCRVPIPWEATGPAMGFSVGQPWLPQPPEFASRAVAEQEGDGGSMLALYRAGLDRRAQHLRNDEFAMLDLGRDVLAFERGGGFVCLVNMGGDVATTPAGTVILSSAPVEDGVLEPETALWMMRSET